MAVRSVEIKYKADSQHGWVPTSWYSARLDKKGEVLDSIAATVTEYKVGSTISDDTFRTPTSARDLGQ